jgi:hypothetical protein
MVTCPICNGTEWVFKTVFKTTTEKTRGLYAELKETPNYEEGEKKVYECTNCHYQMDKDDYDSQKRK